jgi:hypothetical protein
MLDWLRYRYNLWGLHREKHAARRSNARSWQRAQRGQDITEALKNIKTHRWRNDLLIDDEIYQLEADYVQRQAERLLLSIPKFSEISDHWEKSPFTKSWRLTRPAMLELRSAIRAEKKERSELARSWLTGITGLIGVLIGLLAVILGKR